LLYSNRRIIGIVVF